MTRRCLPALALAVAVAAAFALAAPALALNPNHQCAFCHNLHASPGNQLLGQATAEATCLSCHDPAGVGSTLKVAVHTNKPDSTKSPFNITCSVCHASHDGEVNWLGTTNIKLIGRDLNPDPDINVAQIQSPNSGIRDVVFTSRGTDAGGPLQHSFADNDNDANGYYDGVCETCHTDTLNHQNHTVLPDNSNHNHNLGLNCTVCHPHEQSFWGAGGSCLDCHNAPQNNGDGLPTFQTGRREIVSEFSRSSHHVSGAVTAADCEVCHLQDQHQQGAVRLKDPDNPTSGTPLVVLNNDPVNDPTTRASLTAFCTACHDSNGYNADNTAPFSDSLQPPDVSTTWTAAAHNTIGSLTCFGNGTTGCHGTGHGSLKINLLAPPDVAPVTSADEEEGFCFNCHDTDGPSSINVEAGFNTPILWEDDQTQYGNPNLNDRHDVQEAAQTRSGAKIECVNCHDPHAANETNPPMSYLRADPDPTDGRVPGTDWFAGLNTGGLSADAYTEWCLDCHDGSLPPGVTGHTTSVPLRDILNGEGGNNPGWLTNSHGAGPSGAALKTGYAGGAWALDDVVPCWACHQPHPDDTPQPVTTTLFNNLYQMKQTITAKDGTTPIDSDDGQGQTYEITSQTTRRNDLVNSYYLCNTCHTGSMGSGKLNCSDCHAHSDGRF